MGIKSLKILGRAQELEVLSLNHLYSLKTKSSLHNDIMRFLVLGFRSDIRIELQAPVGRVGTHIFFSGKKYNFMQFERHFPFQNA